MRNEAEQAHAELVHQLTLIAEKRQRRIEELERALAQVHGHIGEDPRYQGTVQIIVRVLEKGMEPTVAFINMEDTPEDKTRRKP